MSNALTRPQAACHCFSAADRALIPTLTEEAQPMGFYVESDTEFDLATGVETVLPVLRHQDGTEYVRVSHTSLPNDLTHSPVVAFLVACRSGVMVCDERGRGLNDFPDLAKAWTALVRCRIVSGRLFWRI
jgi:hypothetical protein